MQQMESGQAPPELPTERSGKYGNAEKELKQKKIYEKFKIKLLRVFDKLAKKLPHKKKLYDSLKKMVENYANIEDGKRVWNLWIESIKGYEDRVRVFSKENVKYICENLNKIQLLQVGIFDSFNRSRSFWNWRMSGGTLPLPISMISG